MFIEYNQNQQFLLPPSIEELLSENHLAKVVNEIVENLETTEIKANYTDIGRPPYHPLMMIKILFYAYAIGIRSSRKMAKALETDISFMWLSAMNKPDFRTISDFRKNNCQALKKLFSQIVAVCLSLNLTSIGRITIDSTKIKSVASKKSIHSEKSLRSLLVKVEKEMEGILREAQKIDEEEDKLFGDKRGDELPKELQEKEKRRKKIKEALEKLKERNRKKIALSDIDSSLIKKDLKILPSYNAQAVASEEGFIIAADVTTDEFDNYQMKPMVEEAVKNTSLKPKQVLADAGYYSGNSLSYLNKQKIEAFIPINKNLDKKEIKIEIEEKKEFSKENFTYLPDKDCYTCPKGQKLYFERIRERKKGVKKVKVYLCKKKDCSFKKICTKNKRGRYIERLFHEELYIKMKEKMETEEARKIYSRRKAIIEPVFSIIKGPLSFERFGLKGLEKVKGEWSLICSAFNILKIWRVKQKIQEAGAT